MAHAAVATAQNAEQTNRPATDLRYRDPGYYLISGGRKEFELRIGYKHPVKGWPGRFYRWTGISGYIATCALLAGTLTALAISTLATSGTWPASLVLICVLSIVPAIDLSVALVNYMITRCCPPTLLPAIELRDGIPQALRTLVVTPILLNSINDIEDQVARLEIHYLASPEGELYFALLSDWRDSLTEHTGEDTALLRVALEGIDKLNQRNGPAPGGARFLLLHRRRMWCQSEDQWIGWERKRGKLRELNRLLRGAEDTSFLDPPSLPESVRYVITLDADTQLPRETVGRLIGKMAHPLNQPRFDVVEGRVVEGYALLQPRITPALPMGRESSLFLSIFSRATGIDPYNAAVSDVYQDLFGEGSFAGKGIYDVDAFELALDGRVPESALLSHDLFEGIFARAGLASDVEFIENYPSRYDVAILRQHRWTRGDWQLLPWIFGHGPTDADRRLPIPAIGRWKMFDNLRRSLSAPFAIFALIAGWTLPMQEALVWTALVISTFVIPPLIPVIAAMVVRRPGVTAMSNLRSLTTELRLALAHAGLLIIMLAHQTWLMGDAIFRTLHRLLITRRHLLEWIPAAQATFGPRLGMSDFYRQMFGALVLAAAAVVTSVLWGRGAWPVAMTFAVLWFMSPAVALWSSLSRRALARHPLAEADTQSLRLVARQTWRFFETFVTPKDNMLPPDNFQEVPEPEVAHRTSPTNIGLYLLSVVSAHDFGWIGTRDAVSRLEATFAAMGRMAKFKGHLYNWYDTLDLRPLDPKYISTVDSGNLAGHLIALANACHEWRIPQLSTPMNVRGIEDAVDIFKAEATRLRSRRLSPAILWRRLDIELTALQPCLDATFKDGSKEQLSKLSEQAVILSTFAREIAREEGANEAADLLFWASAIIACIASKMRDRDDPPDAAFDARLEALEKNARSAALEMEFRFLLNPDRLLLSIGYQATEGLLDTRCYDLLASEARLASFFAIAKRDAPTRHWFRLGRAVTAVTGGAALISWSGSMFEYLMPSIVMRPPYDSLIEQTNRLIVDRQIEYGVAQNVPWGMSESAYNVADVEYTYQYSSFGVPGLGLKRGLGDNNVVAPYATALAAMVDPHAAIGNLAVLESMGARGRYGFYEAMDFTPERVPDGETVAIVKTFMAHHQGMTITAIANTLMDGILRKRFHAEPITQATELLLQERVPREVTAPLPLVSERTTSGETFNFEGTHSWRRPNPSSSTPATQILSNGSYSVMLTAAGAGYSVWRDLAVTRWREDSTCDDWGSWIFLRDVASGDVWPAVYQPTGSEPFSHDVIFNEDRVEFTRSDGDLTTSLQVLVSSEDNAEVRRVTITNSGAGRREIEITSYAELVLAQQAADIAHPAFSKLFTETEHLPSLGAILATRRRRTPTEPQIWAAHLAVVDGVMIGKREFETDRAKFIGSSGNVAASATLQHGRALSGSTGAVLDAIFALRRRVKIAPGGTAKIDFWTMVASSREEVLNMVDKHHDTVSFERAVSLAWTQAQVQLHHLGVDRSAAGQYQRLAGHLIYASPMMRASSDTIRIGSGPQSGLWGQGISGDLPIILVRISGVEQLGVAREALQAVEYWRTKRLAVDMVVLNERATSYVQELQTALETLVRASQSRAESGEERPPGHIFLLRSDLMSHETHALLLSVARVILVGGRGRLADQLDRVPDSHVSRRSATRPVASSSGLQIRHPPPGLEFFNGLGGFAENGREYVTILGPGQTTPAPWINVIANPNFGFQASAEGGGYSWSVNSREHLLTPWSNDPVADRPGQAFFLRDLETGEIWCPTVLPIRDPLATYEARHGWGYSRFRQTSHGVASELLEFVPRADSIKISRLSIRNLTDRPKRLSITGYVEWVLGASRTAAAPFVTTCRDPDTGALFASNKWNPDFANRVAFADMAGRQTSWTCDRREFIGRNGSLAEPAALGNWQPLSGRTGSGLDPCAALQTKIEIAPGGSVEICFFLGDGENEADAQALVRRYRDINLDETLAEVRGFWEEIADAVQVKTPDRSMDIMLNGWLLYQTLVCRVWARSSFYQAGGAFGFRDQLQDCMALATTSPSITREHLLKAASHQFPEGDVLHWWLPHSGQGVRTRITDDRIWLAYATAHYIKTTSDKAVLDEQTPFVEGELLQSGESENFFKPVVSEATASLYEHCAFALNDSLQVGIHGLPLIGGGDWNDGMNRVGQQGRGESVWLGWILHAALRSFADFADARGDQSQAGKWRTHAVELKAAAEREAWDGEWYKRGWFDDGAPLGSATNEECRIDSLAQSWAVISGAGQPDRAAQAMAAVERELILPHERLALLFAPPFDHTELDPGYIKGYPPGIRENGGQYTHAALWAVMAFAGLGEGEKAASLFSLLNPINSTRTQTDMHRYKVEPYVVAADVYSAPGHLGRGGWTWYTGSAGWMQRAGIESILGLHIEGDQLRIDPCIPKLWSRYEISLRRGASRYEIVIENPDEVQQGIVSAELDGIAIVTAPLVFPFIDDGKIHRIHISLGVVLPLVR